MTVEITINNKKRIYCSECQQKSEVQAEIKAVKDKIGKVLLISIIVVSVLLALIISVVIWATGKRIVKTLIIKKIMFVYFLVKVEP